MPKYALGTPDRKAYEVDAIAYDDPRREWLHMSEVPLYLKRFVAMPITRARVLRWMYQGLPVSDDEDGERAYLKFHQFGARTERFVLKSELEAFLRAV